MMNCAHSCKVWYINWWNKTSTNYYTYNQKSHIFDGKGNNYVKQTKKQLYIYCNNHMALHFLSEAWHISRQSCSIPFCSVGKLLSNSDTTLCKETTMLCKELNHFQIQMLCCVRKPLLSYDTMLCKETTSKFWYHVV